MGMIRAHDAHVELMRKRNVTGKPAASSDQRRVFQTFNRLSDPGSGLDGHQVSLKTLRTLSAERIGG
jgi:hypothetical protein